VTSNSYHLPVVPETVAVAAGAAAEAGLVFHVRPASPQFTLATGYSPTAILGEAVFSIRPNRRTFAEVTSDAAPTPVRSKRT
jgi:hypothetical protein